MLLTALVVLGGMGTPLTDGSALMGVGGGSSSATAMNEASVPPPVDLAASVSSHRNARSGGVAGPGAIVGAATAVSPDAPRESDDSPGDGVDASATASIEVTEVVEEPLPVFYQYEVQPGDTVSQIAARYGIATDYILWNNVNVIDDADSLATGAMLQIPSVEGIIHSVRVGDTASDIAMEYDSTTRKIVEFEANGFGGDPNMLPVGALILVPDGRRIPPPAPDFEFGDPFAPDPNAPAPGSSDPAPSDPAAPWTPPALQPPPAAAPSWVWPATGRLTNVFSPRHPLGIDISMIVDTPIAAASAGQVTFVGGNPCCSYGYHVIIEHADGMETLYAHLNGIYVSSGQWVGAGEIIGGSGNTGYSTGPHLHFELRRHGVYTDPLGYLP